MTVLTSASVHKHTDKIKHVFFLRLTCVAEVINMVSVDVDGWRKLEMIVNLVTAKVGQVELEAF